MSQLQCRHIFNNHTYNVLFYNAAFGILASPMFQQISIQTYTCQRKIFMLDMFLQELLITFLKSDLKINNKWG